MLSFSSLPFSTALSGESLLAATGMIIGFCALLFLGSFILPGEKIKGPDADGGERTYKMNGLALFIATVVFVALAELLSWFSLSTLHDHFFALFIVANVLAFAFAGFLYFFGQRSSDAPQGFLKGYFEGIHSGPVWFDIDIKLFSYRPSMIGLALLNASFAIVQYQTMGELTLAMILYQAFTFIYVLNYFHFEEGMIHTWDIISERFGWMLIWGDYVLVPFFYCLPAWWLVYQPVELSPLAATALIALFLFGFWLFRGTNQQKHRFKRNPNVQIWGQPAKTLDGRLLISGFWGIGRHLNYTGEICVYFAFTLTTGLISWIPLLLPLWLSSLLFHRSRRDEYRCRAKYGELWDRYVQKARFSMLPFIH